MHLFMVFEIMDLIETIPIVQYSIVINMNYLLIHIKNKFKYQNNRQISKLDKEKITFYIVLLMVLTL